MSSSFSEERLELGYDYGATGGPEFKTVITTVQSGFEHRNIMWSGRSRGSWDVGERKVIKSKLVYLRDFFRTHKGRGIGFRIKDWSDYEAKGSISISSSTTSFQLLKRYDPDPDDSSSLIDDRKIIKPVEDTFSFMKNNNDISSDCAVSTSTGVVTLSGAALGDGTINFSGEFDTPVRFDTDKFTSEFLATDDKEYVFFISSIPIIEIMI